MIMDVEISKKHVLPRELLLEIAKNVPANQYAALYSTKISNVFDSYIGCLYHLHLQKKVLNNLILNLKN